MNLHPQIIEGDNYNISHQFLFHTPIFEIQLDDVDNNKLADIIYQLKEDDKEGMSVSNMGGWHSKFRNENDGAESFDELFQNLRYILPILPFNPNIKELVSIDSWAMINKKGDFNLVHNHLYASDTLRVDLSAVYYVKVPDGDCGNIAFRDPRSVINGNTFVHSRYNNGLEWEHRYPKEGLMYIFPAFLDHMVRPNKTEEDRIAISFNLTVR